MRLPISAACTAAVVLLVAGCGGGPVSDSAPAIPMPSPPPSHTPPSGSAGTGGSGSAQASPGSEPEADLADSCVMVAGGVSSILLAPMSLRSHSDPAELAALRNQILDLRGKVPGELHRDFTVLAAAVEMPPSGSGKFDEPAFREAMRPVQGWLAAHCAEPAAG